MPYALRVFRCVVCGAETTRRKRDGAEVRCMAHAIEVMIGNLTQQHEKAGPTYEKTVRRQLAHWNAEAMRLGLVPQPRR